MEQLNEQTAGINRRPAIRIVQFGEGNFLRAFIAPMIQALNGAVATPYGIAAVQPIPTGSVPQLKAQDGLYTLFTEGMVNEKPTSTKTLIDTIVTAVDPYTEYKSYIDLAREPGLQFIVSNTTEAGIVFDATDTKDAKPPRSFPAKLTQFLFRRFTLFGEAKKRYCIFCHVNLLREMEATWKH